MSNIIFAVSSVMIFHGISLVPFPLFLSHMVWLNFLGYFSHFLDVIWKSMLPKICFFRQSIVSKHRHYNNQGFI